MIAKNFFWIHDKNLLDVVETIEKNILCKSFDKKTIKGGFTKRKAIQKNNEMDITQLKARLDYFEKKMFCGCKKNKNLRWYRTLRVNEILLEYRSYSKEDGWNYYCSDSQISGTVGIAKAINGITIRVIYNNIFFGDTIQYFIAFFEKGWSKTVYLNGQDTELSEPISGIKIILNDYLSDKYGVMYRVHLNKDGWTEWKYNGEEAGAKNFDKKIEAIQIKLYMK